MATCNLKKGTEEVVQQLNELFGNTLNLDIIKSVASSCKFDVYQSSNQLLEITSKNQFHPDASPTMNNLRKKPTTPRKQEQKSKKAADIENAIKKINCGYKVLVLLRGLPGSGKSTLGKSILHNTIGYNEETARNHILSTDDFFMKNGVYRYDANQLSEAHGWNHQRAFQAMSRGFSPVIIDNTNTQMWEMKPYAVMATDYGYIFEILEPDTHWCFNDKELTKRNKHDVASSKIKSMLDRYERNVTPMKLLTAYDCKYKLQKPPQFRLYPPISTEPPKPVTFIVNMPHPETLVKNATPLHASQSFVVAANSAPPTETINLMDFSEPEVPLTTSLETKKLQPNSVKSKSENNVSVDNMLMHNEGSFLRSKVLTPVSSTKIKQSTSLFDNIQSDIQNAWGVDERALRSWDIVTPLSETTREDIEIFRIDDDEEVETGEMSTNTEDEDFYMLRNILSHPPSEGVTILTTCNRDINRHTPVRPQNITRKLMLDKSCLTEDLFEDQNMHLEHLMHVFPNVPAKTLRYWYNKCNRDFDCTIELLLAERDEVISVVIDDDEPEADTKPETNNVEAIIVDSDSGSSSDNESPSPIKKTFKHKRKNNSSSSDETEELKKYIESKVNISDDHYSDKLLKIKQQRFGQPEPNVAPQPSTSTAVEPQSESAKNVSSDMDFSECNSEFDCIEWEELSPDQNQTEHVETMELNLGEHFVKQLEDKFGEPNLMYPKGFQPVVQVPVALARQLYTFYIESVYQQMDAQNSVLEDLVKEDEEFARRLQENEVEAAALAAIKESKAQSEPSEIPDIMKEQKELAKWQKEADKWKELTPDTLAARLTREKLFQSFPSLDRDTLVEILYAHGNVYQDTVEVLLASTNVADVRGHIDTIKDPPISKPIMAEMWEAHESCKVTEDENTARSARDYREEANRCLKKRSDLYEKAQKYYQGGMTEVAQFYSGLASQQTKLFEQANSYAATAFVDEHSKRIQDFNVLDLHFLYVKEAIPTLDVFLDRCINLLRLSPSKQIEYLQIITGRGKNSQNGVARIRPVVISRLKQRKITYQQLNPGLLRIKITKASLVTSEI